MRFASLLPTTVPASLPTSSKASGNRTSRANREGRGSDSRSRARRYGRMMELWKRPARWEKEPRFSSPYPQTAQPPKGRVDHGTRDTYSLWRVRDCDHPRNRGSDRAGVRSENGLRIQGSAHTGRGGGATRANGAE